MEGSYAYEDTAAAGGKTKGAEGEPKKKKSVGEYEGGAAEFWDDYCLAKFLEGVCLRYVAYPVSAPSSSALMITRSLANTNILIVCIP